MDQELSENTTRSAPRVVGRHRRADTAPEAGDETARTAERASDPSSAAGTGAHVPPNAGTGAHVPPNAGIDRGEHPQAGTHSDRSTVLVREHRVRRRRRTWRDVPRPTLGALAGAAVLAAVAGGAIHLSASGSALTAPGDGDGTRITAPATPGTPDASTGTGAGDDTGTGTDAGNGTATGTGDGGAGPTSPSAAAVPGTAADPQGTVVVHVTGAVAAPGIVELPAGSRVDDAVLAAGGARGDADLSAVNLARILVDGEQIHVPVPGEPLPPTAASGAIPPASGTGAQSGDPRTGDGGADGVVDINTADVAELDTLPGVGPAIAQRIVEYREQNGPFASVEDLAEVSGIGPATLARIGDRARV